MLQELECLVANTFLNAHKKFHLYQAKNAFTIM
jgi:hypothetical protein